MAIERAQVLADRRFNQAIRVAYEKARTACEDGAGFDIGVLNRLDTKKRDVEGALRANRDRLEILLTQQWLQPGVDDREIGRLRSAIAADELVVESCSDAVRKRLVAMQGRALAGAERRGDAFNAVESSLEEEILRVRRLIAEDGP
ncbi:MAG TPA: hypothetical protein VH040_11095 [Usitatibacter sp.]|jgi:hypothetical protein|nr:hypothetical protein [Usitatibacter sp.]